MKKIVIVSPFYNGLYKYTKPLYDELKEKYVNGNIRMYTRDFLYLINNKIKLIEVSNKEKVTILNRKVTFFDLNAIKKYNMDLICK